MNVRQHLVLAVATAALSGLAVVPAEAAASASHQATRPAATAAHQASPKALACAYYTKKSKPTLRYGSKGNAVKQAQCDLKYRWKTPKGKKLAIDGRYGPSTTAAVREFQKRVNKNQHAGITVDGIVGKQTWKWLEY